MPNLVFLKLGGSLITDKDQERTPRPDVLQRLAGEIAAARRAHPELGLLIGHGSGSFGHTAARKYHTRAGARSPQDWEGFAEVWFQARALNQLVVEALAGAGLAVVAFPPSAYFMARAGQALPSPTAPLEAALAAGLIPLVNGDTVFDEARGATILSTEELFAALAPILHPERILLAGVERGVFSDFPACVHLVPSITPQNLAGIHNQLQGSASVDVTGGMRQKVEEMLALARQLPGLEAQIFSGLEPGNLRDALQGGLPGTRIHA